MVLAPKVEEVLEDEELLNSLNSLLMGQAEPLGRIIQTPNPKDQLDGNPSTTDNRVASSSSSSSGNGSSSSSSSSSSGSGAFEDALPGACLPVQQYALKAAVYLWLWFDQQCSLMAEEVREVGGLLVLGSSLQESSRIELQLRGRAGRQGDPGTTQLLWDLSDPLVMTHGMACKLGEGTWTGGGVRVLGAMKSGEGVWGADRDSESCGVLECMFSIADKMAERVSGVTGGASCVVC